MPVMQTSDLTPRQYWEQVKANPNRARFGFGEKAVRWHDAFGHHGLRIDEVLDVPFVRVAAANPGKVRSSAL